MWPVQIQQTDTCAVVVIPQSRIIPTSVEVELIESRHALSLRLATPNDADTEAASNITFQCILRPLGSSSSTALIVQSFRYTRTDNSLVLVLNKQDATEWQGIELVVAQEATTKTRSAPESRVFSFVTESNLAVTQSHLREATPWTATDNVRVGKVAAKRVAATNNIHIVAEAI